MPLRPLLAFVTGAAMMIVAPSAAQTSSAMTGESRTPIFSGAPLSNDQLALLTGGMTAHDRRLISDVEEIGFLQQVGRSTSVAMDNWWSQPGAALITDNLLRVR